MIGQPQRTRESFDRLARLLKVITVALLCMALCAGMAGCGSGSGSPGATPTPTPNPVASITSISPTSVPAGVPAFTLTVNGANFLSNSAVQWNGSNRATTFVNGSQLQAQITAADVDSGTTASVTVVNPRPGGGSSNAANLIVTDPLPTLASIFPKSAPAGSLAFTLMLTGLKFVPGSTVEWNGNSRTTTFVSSTQLQAHILAADLATPGTMNVTVLNPSPGGGTSGPTTFTVAVDTIVFQSSRALDGSDAANTNNTNNIWTMNPGGSGAQPLTRLTATGLQNGIAVWSPDGSKIVYQSKRALDGSDAVNTNKIFNIWVMNADGSGTAPLTKLTAALADCSNPAWSPDGSKILFVSSRMADGSDAANANDTDNVWVMNADGTGQVPLTKLTGVNVANFAPAWSPDGNRIVFLGERALDGSDAANANLTTNLWVMNADGSAPAPLTKLTAAGGGAAQGSPVWSPNGSKIAFTADRAVDGSDAANVNNATNLWVINADGSGSAPLTKLTALGVSAGLGPAWSPDSSAIAFSSRQALDGSDALNNARNIWVVDTAGVSLTPLTRLGVTGADSRNPFWLPDGSRLLFASSRALDGSNAANTNGTNNIWVMNSDGSAATPLTKITANNAGSDLPQQP